MNRQLTINQLNELIHLYRDSEKGFRQAAQEVHDNRFRELLAATAAERAGFATRLVEEVKKIGGIPASGGSLPGSLHRGWMNLRYQINLHQHDEVVLQECLRGEEQALGAYEEMLFDHTCPEIEPVVSEQFVKIIEMRDRLREILKPLDNSQDHLLI